MKPRSRPWRALLLAGLVSLVCACATTSNGASPRAAIDPLEPINRTVFAFNDHLDGALLKPLAQAWSDWMPEPVRYVTHNVFSNLGDLWTAANQLLQGKPAEAASDLGRFVVNSTLGFAGAADVASEIGLEKHREDFGQTLGRWGLASGPYLVLPLFGPSTLRDGLGQGFDLAADPLQHVRPAGAHNNAYAARLIDTRAGLLRAGNMLEGAALDRYSFVRDGYLQRRRHQIWDGNPPAEPAEADDDGQPASAPAR